MTTDAPGVFISYRRKESSHIAGRLYDRLVERLGEARVFMDVDSIKPGQDWTEAISRAVAQCGLMLVLIGHQWGQMRRGAARIIETDDPVRLEIEAAFDQGIPIIPVLLEDATMPRHADLPETLAKLTHLQAIHLRHESFKSDVANLLAFVQEVLGAYEKEGGPRRAHVVVKNILDKSEVATPSSDASRLQQADDASGPTSRSGARSGPPPKEPSSRPGRSVARRVLIPLVLLISMLTVGVAAWILRPITSTSPDQASGVETAEPVNSSQDAFTEGVPDAETPPPRKPKAAGAVTGDTRGLYGGTTNKTSCDAVRLVDFLQTHPDKGAAWASVLGMSVDQIPSFVAQLTPVILRADTRVTNHGFVRDHATTFYSILQAGTGVFVDKHGVPAVKCFCGNPLTLARADVPHPYQGNPWPDFDSNKVIVVKPAPSAVKSFKVFDHDSGKLRSKLPGVNVPSPASPAASSVSPSTVDEGSTPAVSPSADTTTAGEDSTGPTESATTDQSNSGDSPTSEETNGTGKETESGKESAKSEETSGSKASEENGTGKTKTGTDNSGNTGTNRDTGTNGGTGTNGEPGGGATGSPGTG
jgi:TIR domain